MMACGLTGHNWVDDEDSWSYFGKGRKFDEEDHKGQTCSKCQESQVEIRKHAHQIVGDACVSCGRGTGKGRWRLRALLRGNNICLLYTSDAADDLLCVDLGGCRII